MGPVLLAQEQAALRDGIAVQHAADVHGKGRARVELFVVVHAASARYQRQRRRKLLVNVAVAGQGRPGPRLVRVVGGIDHNGDLVGFGQNPALHAIDWEVHHGLFIVLRFFVGVYEL